MKSYIGDLPPKPKNNTLALVAFDFDCTLTSLHLTNQLLQDLQKDICKLLNVDTDAQKHVYNVVKENITNVASEATLKHLKEYLDFWKLYGIRFAIATYAHEVLVHAFLDSLDVRDSFDYILTPKYFKGYDCADNRTILDGKNVMLDFIYHNMLKKDSMFKKVNVILVDDSKYNVDRAKDVGFGAMQVPSCGLTKDDFTNLSDGLWVVHRIG